MSNASASERVVHRTCPLCEATCGLELTVQGERVLRVRGDRDDVFSAGYLCPKGVALGELHDDPDRLRQPLLKTATGFRKASWDEAFAAVEAGLAPILARGDRNAVALYAGNPVSHNLGANLYLRPLIRALATQNFYSASTVDQMPKHLVSGLLFGDPQALPVPDVDHCQFLLMLGANPWESNGSLWTAPNLPARLKALRKRGGKLVVLDPRRTRTAAHADEHHTIRPGSDALWLLAVARVIVFERLAKPDRLAKITSGLEPLRELLAPFTPRAVAAHCGIAAEHTERLARELAASPAAAVYARFGTHAARFGTLAAWATELLNVLTGNLDRRGGVMFPRGVHERVRETGSGTGFRFARWRSRVHGHGEVLSELPVATLADEITTPGRGQVRALLTVAGNPVLSTPDGSRLAAALAGLEFMVSVDLYLNETSRHADVILPPPSVLERAHYDLFFYRLSVRVIANYSPAVFDAQGLSESAILARLALIARGEGAGADTGIIDRELLAELVQREQAHPQSLLAGRELDEVLASLDGDTPCERLLDFLLRTGAEGEGFGRRADGLSLARLREHPHGIDFGPLQARLPGLLKTPSGRIELVSDLITGELARLRREVLEQAPGDALLLIGRREFQSNNSWLHNLPSLATGHASCVLHMHPDDARRRGLDDGGAVRIRSAAGSVVVPLAVTSAIAPGVVSLPHGYGHGLAGTRLTVANGVGGASANDLTEGVLEGPSGNAVLNGVAVQVEAA
jgi:anaerobic selenocysteine-containing dehydrogenase